MREYFYNKEEELCVDYSGKIVENCLALMEDMGIEEVNERLHDHLDDCSLLDISSENLKKLIESPSVLSICVPVKRPRKQILTNQGIVKLFDDLLEVCGFSDEFAFVLRVEVNKGNLIFCSGKVKNRFNTDLFRNDTSKKSLVKIFIENIEYLYEVHFDSRTIANCLQELINCMEQDEFMEYLLKLYAQL